MNWQVTLSIVGITVAFLQVIMIYQLSQLKAELREIWSRLNNHYHVVECENDACKRLRTGNVIIPRG